VYSCLKEVLADIGPSIRNLIHFVVAQSSAVWLLNWNKMISWSNQTPCYVAYDKTWSAVGYYAWSPVTLTSDRSSLLSHWLFSRTCDMKPSSTSLDLFKFMAALHSVVGPHRSGILHHWGYKSGVTCSLDLLRTGVNIACNECCSLLCCHISVEVVG